MLCNHKDLSPFQSDIIKIEIHFGKNDYIVD